MGCTPWRSAAAARQAAFLRQAMGWPDALCEPLGRSSAPLLWFGGLLKLMCWMAGAFVLEDGGWSVLAFFQRVFTERIWGLGCLAGGTGNYCAW